jgi:rhamnosyltransferase
MTKIAVLLAAYNGENWIAEQIESILNQKSVNLHLYISVDLSTDNTYAIVTTLAQTHSEITVLPSGKRFGGASLNFYHLLLTVPIENYEYVALSDQDDIWLDGKLARAIGVLEGMNAFGYSGNVTAFWKDGRKKLVKKDYPQAKYDYLFEAPGPGCTFVLKTELVNSIKIFTRNKINLLNEIDCHDWFIYAYARSKNFKWIIDDKSFINYRQHGSNQLGVNDGFRAFFYRAKKLLNGYGMIQSIKIIKLLEIDEEYFVQKWYKSNKIHYLRLAYLTNEIRRRNRDKVLLFLLCIFLFLKECCLGCCE